MVQASAGTGDLSFFVCARARGLSDIYKRKIVLIDVALSLVRREWRPLQSGRAHGDSWCLSWVRTHAPRAAVCPLQMACV